MAPATMSLRRLAATGLATLVLGEASEEPRRLGFSYSPVEMSGNGVSNSPFGQWNGMMNQAQSQLQQASAGTSSQTSSSNSNDPFGDMSMDDSFGPGGGSSNAFANFLDAPTPGPKGMAMTPEAGSQIMQGMIGSFLANKKLQPGEVECLKQGCSALGSSTIGVTNSMQMIMKQFQASTNGGVIPTQKPEKSLFGQGGIFDQATQSAQNSLNSAQQNVAKALGGSAAAPAATATAAPAAAATAPASAPADPADSEQLFNWAAGRRMQTAGVMGAAGGGMDPVMMMGGAAMAMQMGTQVRKVGELGHQIVSKCLQGDVKDTLLTASKNAENPQWLTKSFMANGPEAMSTLAAAQTAWEKGDAQGFGTQLGTGLREVFLSTDNTGKLPEGLPPKKSLMNITGGFMQGFFGPGWTATVKTPEAPDGIKIDLNKCIGGNVGLLQTMWASTMYYYAKENSKTASIAATTPEGQDSKEKQATMMAYTMMQMPSAMKKCGLSEQSQQAIKDAIAGMGKGVSVSYTYPNNIPKMDSKAAISDAANTANDYGKLVSDPEGHSYSFGQELGNMFQSAAVSVLNPSQKYFVDSNGNLKTQLTELAAASGPGAAGSMITPVLLVLTVVVLLLALIALKSRRALQGWDNHLCQSQCGVDGERGRAFSGLAQDDLEDVNAQSKRILDDAVE
eukprot:TRINITY_DN33_c0_g1_i2.p1 TRINITY_DN33_c0_g1~~TRINITY_DN33_c0_g1_i2.p1  ORF type:complete len:696 (-),score=164.18 TRINITY_DN33_c0_g1_i2:126-2156(-)